MLIALHGLDGDFLGWTDHPTDDGALAKANFCAMVGYGYVYILMVQLVSIAAGEKWPVMVIFIVN